MKKVKASKPQPEPSKLNTKSKSLYEKYKCQYKKKSILTKLNNDSGYPQQLLHTRGSSLPQNSNYVQENKRHLKNFFKDRIPVQNNAVTLLMKKETEMIHPKRIFEIKQMQFELKNRTKISLKNSFEIPLDNNRSSNFEKLDSNFHINDKNRELKEKYGGGGRQSFVHYETDNYRKGTQSHIEKRSKLLKKQAYDKVFGPDISSMSRTNGFQRRQIYMESPSLRPKSNSLCSPYQQSKTHKHLKHLIHKMHDYKNKLDQTDDVLKLTDEAINNAENEETMVTLIQNMTKLYQQKSINQGTFKMESLEDIGKLSKKFYEEMLNHKVHRLAKRKETVFQTLPVVHNPSSYSQETPFRSFNTQRIQPDAQSQISAEDHDSIEEDDPARESTELVRAHFTNAVRYRFTLLRKTLVKWAALFYIYGIHKEDIFLAFRANKEPYALQGSYAFFKFIKNGDLEPVQTFLNNHRQFAFEVETSGKTPISYAAYYNQTSIALAILKAGVNSDMRCSKGHTALYYAISRGNIQIVKALLQRGACPWSSPRNPYRQMISQGEHSQQLQILFNNARKIYIGMQLQPTIEKRKSFWDHAHMRIQQKEILTYEDF